MRRRARTERLRDAVPERIHDDDADESKRANGGRLLGTLHVVRRLRVPNRSSLSFLLRAIRKAGRAIMETRMIDVDALRAEVRVLRRFMYIMSATVAVALLGAASGLARTTKVDQITVHRMNLVDDDGTLRLAISNRQRLPVSSIDGKPVVGRAVSNQPSFIFYNKEGDEQGGWRWDGGRVHMADRSNMIRSRWINISKMTT